MFDYISVDWGSERVGLAFGDSETSLVIPFTEECLNKNAMDIIKKEVRVRKLKKVILGWPTNFKGGQTEVSVQIQSFMNEMYGSGLGVNIDIYNERGTTKAAKADSPNCTKDDLNHLAATKLLQSYFTYNLKI